MKYTIATLASHSCLQILKGAKDEGFSTLAIATPKKNSFYQRFSFIDEVLTIPTYQDLYNIQNNLKKRNVIIIPHGSFVAYLGNDYDNKLKLLHYGNKKVLSWEGDRLKQREWLEKAGIRLPKLYKNPEDIDRLVIVKFYGALGGSGYFVAKNKNDFAKKIEKINIKEFIIQEYIIGIPIYLQFFYSPLSKQVELLGVDRRYETNVDGLGRLPHKFQEDLDLEPSYTVAGNFPIVIRESLLPEAYNMAESVIKTSQKIIPPRGLYGPFCIETIVTNDLEFYVMEISCRIVAGTNLFSQGSTYSDYHFDKPMSTGRRIAREIKEALEIGGLAEILN
ncbi:formate--phosphoribosylaminoimidazolecarboxamide ligase [Candidatus Gottesmanbacteria bacterium]|nr:formate--phosphoribosylaminoimidazolecarboxamide ligase [Candidatus Gottesmanbacteria bacterium]